MFEVFTVVKLEFLIFQLRIPCSMVVG